MEIVELGGALEDLRSEFEQHGTVPPAWREAFAPDGDLAPAWNACSDPMTLLLLHDRLGGPRPKLVLAACALARETAKMAGSTDPRTYRAIEIAEAWANGREATPEEIRDAMTEAYLASGRDPEIMHTMAGEPGADAATCALMSISNPEAVAGIVPGFVSLSPGYDRRLGAENAAQNARAAVLVRAHLDCPKLPSANA